jgi:hypothetical protein
MDPVDFLILSGVAGGLMVVSGERYRHAADGRRRPGAQLAAVGTTLGHIAGRSAALSGQAVGMGIEAAAVAASWPTGLVIDGTLGILDTASRAVGGLVALRRVVTPGASDATRSPSA